MSHFDTAETENVAALLQRAGFNVSPPVEHRAKNPDLLVDGSRRFWAEVKSLGDAPQVKSFDLAREYLAPRLKALPCAADLYVSERTAHLEYKLLHRLILRAVSEQSRPSFALLSDGYNSEAIYKYTLALESGERATIVAHLNNNCEVVAPWQLGTPKFGQTFCFGKEGDPKILRKYADEFLVGAHLYNAPPHTGLLGTTHARGMWKSTSQTRLRRDVAKANKQISAACKIENLPGVVILVGHASPQSFVCALLGDAMIAVPSLAHEQSEAYYGRNGAFTKRQNTHVSASYLVNGSEVYYLPNPFASQRIENVIATARAISIDESGAVAIPR